MATKIAPFTAQEQDICVALWEAQELALPPSSCTLPTSASVGSC